MRKTLEVVRLIGAVLVGVNAGVQLARSMRAYAHDVAEDRDNEVDTEIRAIIAQALRAPQSTQQHAKTEG